MLPLATGVVVATLWATPAMLGSGQPAVVVAATAGAACPRPDVEDHGRGLTPGRGALGYLVVVVPWLARIASRSPGSRG